MSCKPARQHTIWKKKEQRTKNKDPLTSISPPFPPFAQTPPPRFRSLKPQISNLKSNQIHNAFSPPSLQSLPIPDPEPNDLIPSHALEQQHRFGEDARPLAGIYHMIDSRRSRQERQEAREGRRRRRRRLFENKARGGQLTNRHDIPLALALGQREELPNVIANLATGRQSERDLVPLGRVAFLFPQDQQIPLRTPETELVGAMSVFFRVGQC